MTIEQATDFLLPGLRPHAADAENGAAFRQRPGARVRIASRILKAAYVENRASRQGSLHRVQALWIRLRLLASVENTQITRLAERYGASRSEQDPGNPERFLDIGIPRSVVIG